jgi:hypothetical protein
MPLPPLEGVAAAIRRGLTVLREPTFARAHRQTLWLVAVAVALIVAGQVAGSSAGFADRSPQVVSSWRRTRRCGSSP